MYDALTIAKEIIALCNSQGIKISNMKLNQLLYFLQGEFYSIKNTRLIKEDFYVRRLGVMIPIVYKTFIVYYSFNIPQVESENNDYITEEHKDIILKILKKYQHYAVWQLINIIRNQTPYKYTYLLFGIRTKIPNKIIKDYFLGCKEQ